MTTYKGIRGLTIRTVAGDPDPLITGDIWYSTATRKIRGAKIGAGAWASGGDLTTARGKHGTCGTYTAVLASGGGGPYRALVETYNGSTWTEVGDLNRSRLGLASSGTTTAALSFGGYHSPSDPDGNKAETELWDGSSWTEVGDLNTSRQNLTNLGSTSTAAVAIGGNIDNPGTAGNVSETWNGTSWTEGGNLNTARVSLGGAGAVDHGSVFGGGSPPTGAIAESYD